MFLNFIELQALESAKQNPQFQKAYLTFVAIFEIPFGSRAQTFVITIRVSGITWLSVETLTTVALLHGLHELAEFCVVNTNASK